MAIAYPCGREWQGGGDFFQGYPYIDKYISLAPNSPAPVTMARTAFLPLLE